MSSTSFTDSAQSSSEFASYYDDAYSYSTYNTANEVRNLTDVTFAEYAEEVAEGAQESAPTGVGSLSANVIVRATLLSVILILWIICLVFYRRYRKKFPFALRVNGLLVLYYGFILLNLTSLAVGLPISEAARCPQQVNGYCDSDYIHFFVYAFTVPAVATIACIRGHLLLFRHEITETSARVVELTAQPREAHEPALDRRRRILVAKSKKNFWFNRRHWITKFYVLRFTCVYLCLHLIYTIIMLTVDPWNTILISNVIAVFALLINVPYLAFKLHARFNDNFGLLTELKYGSMCAIVLVSIFLIAYILEPTFTSTFGLAYWFIATQWSVILYTSIIRGLLLVNREGTNQGSHLVVVSTMSNAMTIGKDDSAGTLVVANAPSMTITGSMMFKTFTCEDFSFEGVINSAQGYRKLKAFMKNEFASNNLEFCQKGTILRNSIKSKLKQLHTIQIQEDHAALESLKENDFTDDALEMKRKQLSTIMETSVINHVVEEAEEAEAQFSRDSTRTRADAYAPEVLEIHHPHQTNVETEVDWRSRSDSEGDEELHHSDTLGEFPQPTVTLTVEEEQQQQQQQQQQVLPTWELAHSFVSEMREIYALYVRRGALNEIDISDTLARDTRTLVKNIETMLKTHPVVTRLSMDSPLMSIRQHQHTLRKIANVYKTCVDEKLYDIKMDSFNRFTMSPLFAELKAQAKQKLQDAKRSDQLALTIYR